MSSTSMTYSVKNSENKWLIPLGRLLGAIGIVLLISSPLTWLLTQEFGLWLLLKIGFSVGCIGFYLLTHLDFFTRLRGARSAKLWLMSLASTVIVFAMIVGVNIVVYQNPKEYDLTKEGLYTLSTQTQTLLKELTIPVKVTAFYASYDPQFSQTKEVLERYQHLSKNFTYTLLDPQARPDLVEKYQLTEQGPRIVIEANNQDTRIRSVDEQELTNGLMQLTLQNKKAIYFLTGHHEGDIQNQDASEGYQAVAEAVRREGYRVESFSLQAAPLKTSKVDLNKPEAATLEVPKEADVVVILGARNKLLAPEMTALENYLNRGGRMLVLLDPNVDIGIDTLLAKYKITAQKDFVVDTNPVNAMLGLGAAAVLAVPADEQNDITKKLSAPVILFTTRSLAENKEGAPGVYVRPLLRSGETAWGETALKDGQAEQDKADHLGPIDLALVAIQERATNNPENYSQQTRLMVFGDADWLNNRYLTMQGNTDMLLNSLAYLAEEEGLMTIRPKMRAASQLMLSEDKINALKFLSMDFLPVLIVAIGLGVVLIRRQR